MDQLYTYEILQELKSSSFDDYWILIIEIFVQATVLFLTIRWSVALSKKEFERQSENDKAEKKQENDSFKKFHKNLLKTGWEVYSDDIIEFEEIIITNYDINKGLNPVSIMPIPKEFEILDSLDRFRLDLVYNERLLNKDFEKKFYYSFYVISKQIKYYNEFLKELNDYNYFLENKRSPLTKSLMDLENYILNSYKENSKHFKNLDTESTEILSEFGKYNNENYRDFQTFYKKINDLKHSELYFILNYGNNLHFLHLESNFNILNDEWNHKYKYCTDKLKSIIQGMKTNMTYYKEFLDEIDKG